MVNKNNYCMNVTEILSNILSNFYVFIKYYYNQFCYYLSGTRHTDIVNSINKVMGEVTPG